MVKGFHIKPNELIPPTVYCRYMAIRESILGYISPAPELSIPIGDKQTSLKPATHGLVETQAEAEKLLSAISKAFPEYSWSIEQMLYPEAAAIDWKKITPSDAGMLSSNSLRAPKPI